MQKPRGYKILYSFFLCGIAGAISEIGFVLGTVFPYYGCYLCNCLSFRFGDSGDTEVANRCYEVGDWSQLFFVCSAFYFSCLRLLSLEKE